MSAPQSTSMPASHTSLPTALTVLGDPFSYQTTATNLPSHYAASGLPQGLSRDPQTGLISGSTDQFGAFAVRLSAMNPGGAGTATLSLEVAPSGPFAGFAYVSSRPVDTTGWFVAVNQAFAFGGQSGVNVAAPTTWTLPATMDPGQIEFRTDDEKFNYFRGDIPWAHNGFGGVGREGWVMLIDDDGTLVDFVAWGYSAAELASINLNIQGHRVRLGRSWQGDGVPWNSGNNRALLRGGDEDTDADADWD